MKKKLALILTILLCFSLTACGSENNQIVGNWESLYSSGKLCLNKDKTMTIGENSGTWSKDGSCLTVNYTVQSNGNSIEIYYDIIEENGITMLRSRKSGKTNGEVSNFAIYEYYPEDKINEVKSSIVNTLGKKVSTDIMEVTVDKAELSYYAISPSTSTSSGKTTNINEACSPSAKGSFFTANKGRTLVCLDFTLTNTDRNSLDTDDYILSFFVKQNENGATVRGYDLNNDDGSYGLNLNLMPIAVNGQDFYTNRTSNEIIQAGESIRVKYVGIVSYDADLSNPFELVVNIKNSNDNSESFIYAVG